MLRRKCQTAPLVAMIDANGRLGSEESPSVGCEGAEQQCDRGRMLHEWLMETRGCVPATMNERHRGGQATWFPPNS